MCLNECLVRIG